MKRPDQPDARRVLIVKSGLLLDEGIESLLREEEGLQVTAVAYANETAFLQDVSNARPDVIVLDEASALDPVRIFGLLKDLLAPATLRLIILQPADNTMDVYEKRRVIATRSADLLALVRG